MTIPRKGRRSISVDSIDYHYAIPYERSERVVIQLATGQGSCLFVFTFAIMKPSHVADAIRFGISCGWRPQNSDDKCWLVFDVDGDDRSHFEHLSNDDFRVVTYPSKGKLPANTDESQFSDTRPWYNRPSPAVGAKTLQNHAFGDGAAERATCKWKLNLPRPGQRVLRRRKTHES